MQNLARKDLDSDPRSNIQSLDISWTYGKRRLMHQLSFVVLSNALFFVPQCLLSILGDCVGSSQIFGTGVIVIKNKYI